MPDPRSPIEKPKNIFGAETPEEQNLLCKQLEQCYDADAERRGGALGTPDRNHKITAEAMRLRLLAQAGAIGLFPNEYDKVVVGGGYS